MCVPDKHLVCVCVCVCFGFLASLLLLPVFCPGRLPSRGGSNRVQIVHGSHPSQQPDEKVSKDGVGAAEDGLIVPVLFADSYSPRRFLGAPRR